MSLPTNSVTGFVLIAIATPSLRAQRGNPVFSNLLKNGLLRHVVPRNDGMWIGSIEFVPRNKKPRFSGVFNLETFINAH